MTEQDFTFKQLVQENKGKFLLLGLWSVYHLYLGIDVLFRTVLKNGVNY